MLLFVSIPEQVWCPVGLLIGPAELSAAAKTEEIPSEQVITMDSFRVVASMLRYSYGIDKDTGKIEFCWVTQITPGSKAAKAGIRLGDDLVEIDGIRLSTLSRFEFEQRIGAEVGPGETRILTFRSRDKALKGPNRFIKIQFVGK